MQMSKYPSCSMFPSAGMFQNHASCSMLLAAITTIWPYGRWSQTPARPCLQVFVPAKVARYKVQVFACLIIVSTDMLVSARSVEQVRLCLCSTACPDLGAPHVQYSLLVHEFAKQICLCHSQSSVQACLCVEPDFLSPQCMSQSGHPGP